MSQTLADYLAASTEKDPKKVIENYRADTHLDLLRNGEFNDELASEIDQQLIAHAAEKGIQIEGFSAPQDSDPSLVARHALDTNEPEVADAARRYQALLSPNVRDSFDDPAEYEAKREEARIGFEAAAPLERREAAKRAALDRGDLPFAAFTDKEGNRRVELGPEVLGTAGDDAALAEMFQANPSLDRNLIPEIRRKLATPDGFTAPLAKIERQNDFMAAYKPDYVMTNLAAAVAKGETLTDAQLEQADTDLAGTPLAEQFSPEERKAFLRDYATRTAPIKLDPDAPESGLRTLSTGEVHVPVAVMMNRATFDKVLPKLPEAQRAMAEATREQVVSQYAKEAFKTIAARRPEFTDHYAAEKAKGKTDTEILDEWTANPSNQSTAYEYASGIAESIPGALVTAAAAIPALAGSKTAASLIRHLDTTNQQRKEFANLLGKDLGVGFDIATMIAPVVVDIFATKGAASIARSTVGAAARAAVKPVVRGFFGATVRQETKGLVNSFVRGSVKRELEREGLGAAGNVALRPTEVLNAIGRDIEQGLTRAEFSAGMFASGFNRAAGSSYVQTYSTLEGLKNPDGSRKFNDEQVRDMAVKHATTVGTMTGLTTLGFNALGAAGLERIFDGGLTQKQLGSVFTRLSKDWKNMAPAVREGVDMTSANTMLATMMKKSMTPLWKVGVQGAAEEFPEEATQQFLEDALTAFNTDQKFDIVKSIKGAMYAGMLGGVMGGGATVTADLVSSPEVDARREAAVRRNALLTTAAKLDATAPQTAAAVRKLAEEGIPQAGATAPAAESTPTQKDVPQGGAAAGMEQAPSGPDVVSSPEQVEYFNFVMGEPGPTAEKSKEELDAELEGIVARFKARKGPPITLEPIPLEHPDRIYLDQLPLKHPDRVLLDPIDVGDVALYGRGLTVEGDRILLDRVKLTRETGPAKTAAPAAPTEDQLAQQRHEARKKLLAEHGSRHTRSGLKPGTPAEVRAELEQITQQDDNTTREETEGVEPSKQAAPQDIFPAGEPSGQGEGMPDRAGTVASERLGRTDTGGAEAGDAGSSPSETSGRLLRVAAGLTQSDALNAIDSAVTSATPEKAPLAEKIKIGEEIEKAFYAGAVVRSKSGRTLTLTGERNSLTNAFNAVTAEGKPFRLGVADLNDGYTYTGEYDPKYAEQPSAPTAEIPTVPSGKAPKQPKSQLPVATDSSQISSPPQVGDTVSFTAPGVFAPTQGVIASIDAKGKVTVKAGKTKYPNAKIVEQTQTGSTSVKVFHGNPNGGVKGNLKPTKADDFPLFGSSVSTNRAVAQRYADDVDFRQSVGGAKPKVSEFTFSGKIGDVSVLRAAWEATGKPWSDANAQAITDFAIQQGYDAIDLDSAGMGEQGELVILNPSSLQTTASAGQEEITNPEAVLAAADIDPTPAERIVTDALTDADVPEAALAETPGGKEALAEVINEAAPEIVTDGMPLGTMVGLGVVSENVKTLVAAEGGSAPVAAVPEAAPTVEPEPTPESLPLVGDWQRREERDRLKSREAWAKTNVDQSQWDDDGGAGVIEWTPPIPEKFDNRGNVPEQRNESTVFITKQGKVVAIDPKDPTLIREVDASDPRLRVKPEYAGLVPPPTGSFRGFMKGGPATGEGVNPSYSSPAQASTAPAEHVTSETLRALYTKHGADILARYEKLVAEFGEPTVVQTAQRLGREYVRSSGMKIVPIISDLEGNTHLMKVYPATNTTQQSLDAVRQQLPADKPDTRFTAANSPVAKDIAAHGDLANIKAWLTSVAKTGKPEHRELAKILLRFPDVLVTPVHLQDAPFAGTYVPQTGQVLINTARPGPRGGVDTVLHELIHAATHAAIKNPTPEQAQVLKRIDAIRRNVAKRAAKAGRTDLAYGLGSNDEFFTHLLTSPAFQRDVAAMTPKGERNWVQVLIDAVRDLLGMGKVPQGVLKDMIEFTQSVADLKYGRHAMTTDGRVLMLPAHHGTPHKIVGGFDLGKIGTGEGMQAFGYGFYFAQNVGVAKSYLTSNQYRLGTGSGRPTYQGEDLAAWKGATGMEQQSDVVYILGLMEEQKWTPKQAFKYLKDAGEEIDLDIADFKAAAEEPPPGNLYTVELLLDDDEMLDYDKPLSEQSEKVKKILEDARQAYLDNGNYKGLYAYETDSVVQLLYQVRMHHPDPAKDDGKFATEAEASARLRELGIKGIRFLDGPSRGKGEGDYNYVVFDPKDIQITHENGVPVTPEQATAPAPGPYGTARMDALMQMPEDVRDEVRFAELTESLGESPTQADIDSFKAENAAAYAELKAMRERVLRGAGFTIKAWHGSPAGRVTNYNTPSFFTDNPAEAKAYSFENEAKYIKWLERSLVESDGSNLVGKTLKYHGILGDAKVGEIVVTDYYPIARRLPDGRTEIFKGVQADEASYDGNASTFKVIAGEVAEDHVRAKDEVQESIADARARAENGGDITPNVEQVLLRIKNPKKLPMLEGNRFGKRLGSEIEAEGQDTMPKLIAAGYDGVETPTDADFMSMDPSGATNYVVFDPNQIKSTEPLSLDPATGQLIPPSQWGDAESPSILFQPSGDQPSEDAQEDSAFNNEVQKYVTGNWPSDAAGRFKELVDFMGLWGARYGSAETDGDTDIGPDGQVYGQHASRSLFGGVTLRFDAFDVEQTSNATINKGGDVTATIRGAVAFGVADISSEQEAKQLIAREIQEEVIHAAHFTAFVRANPGLADYETAANDALEELFNVTYDTAEEKAALSKALMASQELYKSETGLGLDFAEAVGVGQRLSPYREARINTIAELVRQIIQIRRSSDITETTYRRIMSRARDWFTKFVEVLKDFSRNSGNVLDAEVAKVEAILDEAGILFQPSEDPQELLSASHDAGIAALDNPTDDETTQLREHRDLTTTGNISDRQRALYRTDATALERLVTYLKAAVAELGKALKASFNMTTAVHHDRLSRELAAARDGYRIRSGVKAFDANDGPLFQFAGENANVPTFMQDSLDTAKAMAAAGKTSEEIRAVTGWFPGKYDGKMRWEIPDAGSNGKYFDRDTVLSLDVNKKAETTLGAILYHQELFKSYPNLASLKVFLTVGPIKNGDSVLAGKYTKGNPGYITLQVGDVSLLTNESKSILLHEVQHAIQAHEGFSRGGNPEGESIFGQKVKIASLEEEGRVLWGLVELARKGADLSSRYDVGGIPKIAEQIRGIFPEESQESIEWWLRNLSKRKLSYPITLEEAERAFNEQEEELMREASRDTKDEYNRTAGEIEARDVQARAEMTHEQLAATAPYSSENIAPATFWFGNINPIPFR